MTQKLGDRVERTSSPRARRISSAPVDLLVAFLHVDWTVSVLDHASAWVVNSLRRHATDFAPRLQGPSFVLRIMSPDTESLSVLINERRVELAWRLDSAVVATIFLATVVFPIAHGLLHRCIFTVPIILFLCPRYS